MTLLLERLWLNLPLVVLVLVATMSSPWNGPTASFVSAAPYHAASRVAKPEYPRTGRRRGNPHDRTRPTTPPTKAKATADHGRGQQHISSSHATDFETRHEAVTLASVKASVQPCRPITPCVVNTAVGAASKRQQQQQQQQQQQEQQLNCKRNNWRNHQHCNLGRLLQLQTPSTTTLSLIHI